MAFKMNFRGFGHGTGSSMKKNGKNKVIKVDKEGEIKPPPSHVYEGEYGPKTEEQTRWEASGGQNFPRPSDNKKTSGTKEGEHGPKTIEEVDPSEWEENIRLPEEWKEEELKDPKPAQSDVWSDKATRLVEKRTKKQKEGKSTKRIQKRINKELRKLKEKKAKSAYKKTNTDDDLPKQKLILGSESKSGEKKEKNTQNPSKITIDGKEVTTAEWKHYNKTGELPWYTKKQKRIARRIDKLNEKLK